MTAEFCRAGEGPILADSVEKLGRSVHRCPAAKSHLSDRPRIDDRDLRNGLITPKICPGGHHSSFSTESAECGRRSHSAVSAARAGGQPSTHAQRLAPRCKAPRMVQRSTEVHAAPRRERPG